MNYADLRGTGLRQSAQTFGAIVGASIAAATFRFSGSNYIATFALSAIPAVVALLVVTLVRRAGLPIRCGHCALDDVVALAVMSYGS